MLSIPPVAETIIFLVLATMLSYVLVRAAIAYRTRGGKLPIDIQRLLNLRKWWSYSEWTETDASITETRICVPDNNGVIGSTPTPGTIFSS
jgi:hypothetical protein